MTHILTKKKTGTENELNKVLGEEEGGGETRHIDENSAAHYK
jgi:hypothetical protein